MYISILSQTRRYLRVLIYAAQSDARAADDKTALSNYI